MVARLLQPGFLVTRGFDQPVVLNDSKGELPRHSHDIDIVCLCVCAHFFYLPCHFA